jgi:hypothetical protein
MTATITPGGPQYSGDGKDERWQPATTEKEAVGHGLVSKSIYKTVTLWARTVVEYHQALGTPLHLREPMATHVDLLVGPYIEDGENELADRLASDVDPLLDEAHQGLAATKARLDAAQQHPHPVITPESGSIYTGTEAVQVVADATHRIESDFRAGRGHHGRTSGMVKRIGRFAPWMEAAGLLGFIAFFLNVPLLRPWEDWLGFTLAVAIVFFTILGQSRLVHHAAEDHNHAREAVADNNRHQAEAAYTNRNRYLAIVAIIAVAITAGMVLRGTALLGDASIGVTVVLVFLAALTGLLMPTISYLAIALDGSRVSRERDSLATDLEEDFAQQSDLKDESQASLELVTDTMAVLVQKIFPDICTTVQATVDAAYAPYNFGRFQVGGLVADPPVKTRRSLQQGPAGAPQGEISTGIAGARVVDLLPLIDRVNRLHALDSERAELAKRLNEIPPHPWAKSSNTR